MTYIIHYLASNIDRGTLIDKAMLDFSKKLDTYFPVTKSCTINEKRRGVCLLLKIKTP